MKAGFYFDKVDGCLWLVSPSGKAEWFSTTDMEWKLWSGTAYGLRTWLNKEFAVYIKP